MHLMRVFESFFAEAMVGPECGAFDDLRSALKPLFMGLPRVAPFLGATNPQDWDAARCGKNLAGISQARLRRNGPRASWRSDSPSWGRNK
jgi:hypothetical protein